MNSRVLHRPPAERARVKHGELLSAYRVAPLPTRFPDAMLDFLTSLWHVGLFVREEWQPPVRVGASKRWRAWRRGFSTRSSVLYRLGVSDPSEYLSDYAGIKTHRINGPFNALFRNKLVFAELMQRFGVPHPRVHALLHRGTVRAVDGTSRSASLDRWLSIRPHPGERLVLKPTFGGGGRGILFMSRRDGALEINGLAASLDEARSLLSPRAHYLVTDVVEQAAYAARVYPRTTNTVRVLTLWNELDDAPFIAAASHRFGSRRSFPLDSFHRGRGGLSARIDEQTGELGPGATLSDDGELCWHDRHPDSDVSIRGLTIPRWTRTKDTILEAAARLPYAPAVGWDLVVTETGCCVLEGNSPPNPAVWQVHAPLLKDSRVRAFYERHGIV